MALATSFFSLTLNDNTVNNGRVESGNVELPITTLTPANVAAQLALVGNLLNALEGITIGNPGKSAITWERTLISANPASDPLAQRENKWLMRYHGNTLQKKFQASLPTADLTQLANNSEFLLLTGGTGAALKTAFEAIVKSPDDATETTTLDSVQFVGRNT